MSDDLVRSVLRSYAELSPTTGGDRGFVVARPDDLVSFGTAVDVESRGPFRVLGHLELRHVWPDLERLAKLDALHSEEQLLRQGWITLVGTITIDGQPVRVRHPMVSRAVSVRHRSGLDRLAADSLTGVFDTHDLLLRTLSEFELTPLVVDPARRSVLLMSMEFGRGGLTATASTERFLRRFPALTGWIRAVTDEIGVPRARILPFTARADDWIDRPGLVAIVEHTLYLTRRTSTPSQRNTLLDWVSREGLGRTALHATLTATAARPDRGRGTTAEDSAGSDPAESPLLLSASQRAVVRRARTSAVTVVSGAPGSGKTHTVCAIALDAVANGRSVLIATQSRYAADVVTELLHRTPGPEPVRFGNGIGMTALIDELSDLQTHPIAVEDVRALDAELEMARVQVEGLRTSLAADLQLEIDAAESRRWQDALPSLVAAAPLLFALDSDLDAAERSLRTATAAATVARSHPGPLRRWTARRARRDLDRVAGSGSVDLDRIDLALGAARAGRAAATLAARGGLHPGDRWDRLLHAEQVLRDGAGRRLRVRPLEAASLGGSTRVALGQLIAALRAGRGRRRELLAAMHPGQLTSAAPMWIGTLSEIEDVLPASAGLFDLVVLDEASQIEQSRAAPALLRAQRAVIVGDPHQLHHVSFQSDDAVDAALERHGLSDWRGLLDVRRVSAFDLAATTAPVDQLRDHFRSVPHLIEFSVRHFYRDRVDVMTRHPRNETFDAIDMVGATAPPRAESGVHPDEVQVVVELVRALHAEGVRSVGVISPFRDQADALEAALVTNFTAAEIDAMSLRVGTVHAFQGGEREVVIASLALGPDDTAGRRRFLESPNLFNVMITRARARMIVVTSLTLSDTGLIGEYLRYAEQALAPVPGAETLEPWARSLATELRRNGATVRESYPVGPWLLDLCVGDGDACRYLECAVSPDGSQAHIDRHLTLMRLGWTIIDAYPSMWDGDAVRAALELRDRT